MNAIIANAPVCTVSFQDKDYSAPNGGLDLLAMLIDADTLVTSYPQGTLHECAPRHRRDPLAFYPAVYEPFVFRDYAFPGDYRRPTPRPVVRSLAP